MRKYFSFLRIRFIAGLQYRAAAVAGMATQFAWGAMSLLMFSAFYEAGASDFPMDFQALSSYIWLQQALLAMFMAWYFDNEIFESITSGGISYDLCRPVDIYWMWFVKNIAVRLAGVVLRCVPILAVAAVLPAPWGVAPPSSFASAVLFAVSLILGLLVLVAFSMLIYISAFFTISADGIRILAVSVIEFFSGAIVPLPFFPEQLQSAMNFLPFSSIQSTPFLIYVGQYDIDEAIGGMILQLTWLAALIIFGRLLIKKALKRVVVQGG